MPVIMKRIVGYWCRRDDFRQSLIIDRAIDQDRLYKFLITGEFQKVLIGDVLVNAVRDKNILPSIVVHVKKQCTPTPVRRFHSCQPAYLAEAAISVVELEHVTGKLVRSEERRVGKVSDNR